MSHRDEARAEVMAMRRKIRRMAKIEREPTFSETFLAMLRGLLRRVPAVDVQHDAAESASR